MLQGWHAGNLFDQDTDTSLVAHNRVNISCIDGINNGINTQSGVDSRDRNALREGYSMSKSIVRGKDSETNDSKVLTAQC